MDLQISEGGGILRHSWCRRATGALSQAGACLLLVHVSKTREEHEFRQKAEWRATIGDMV